MRRIAVYWSIVIVATVLLAACNRDDSGVDAGINWTDPGYYSTESEPSLSTDREYIYFITQDSLFFFMNGIFRAQVTAPAREKVLEGYGFQSPVLFPNKSAVAFLAGGSLNYLNLATNVVTYAGVAGNYDAIVFFNDSLIVGSIGTSLLLINQKTSQISAFGSGSDPTYYAPGEIVCLSKEAGGIWQVHKRAYQIDEYGAEIIDNVLTTITAEGDVRWLSMEPAANRYVYVEQRDTANLVFTGQVGSTVKNFIDRTKHVKACMLGYNILIYQGPDGRFYQSDFAGTQHWPYWYAEEADL